MSVAGAMIAGELYGGTGNDSVILASSLGGVIELAGGADSLVASASTAATVSGGTDNDTFSFSGVVHNSSLVGGFGADSITVGGQLRASTVFGGDPSDGGSPIDGKDYIVLALLLLPSTAIVTDRLSSAVMPATSITAVRQ